MSNENHYRHVQQRHGPTIEMIPVQLNKNGHIVDTNLRPTVRLMESQNPQPVRRRPPLRRNDR